MIRQLFIIVVLALSVLARPALAADKMLSLIHI